VNSRGRNPRDRLKKSPPTPQGVEPSGFGSSTPCRVGQKRDGLLPWVSPTAIHIFPLRGNVLDNSDGASQFSRLLPRNQILEFLHFPHTQPSTLSTQHSALSPQSYLLGPQHSALSPQSYLLGPQHSALSPQSYLLGPQHSALSTQSSALSPLLGIPRRS